MSGASRSPVRAMRGIEWQSISTRDAEGGDRIAQQALQRRVIGQVDALDPHAGVVEGQPLAIDRLVLGDDAGQRAEAGGDARAGGVEAIRQRLDEHLRVEFPGLAVDVEIGAREMRAQQRRAQMRGAGEQLVDIGVLGLADRQMVEPRHVEEALGIVAAGMGGVEHHGRGQPARPDGLESRPVPIVGPQVHAPETM